MKTESIANKIRSKLIIAGIIIISISALISFYMISKMEKEVELTTKKHFELLINERIKSKMEIGLSNAISLSKNTDIMASLDYNDRDTVKLSLDGVSDAIKSGTTLKNVKIHVHDKNVKSFFRAWNPDKYGDDLSSFRKTIVKVKETLKPLSAIEVGRAGLVLRGIAPIFTIDNDYLGSVEYIQGFNSTVETFKKDDEFLLVLMDEKYKRGNALDKQEKIGKYYLSQNIFDEESKGQE
eukprot:TRINITY_DN140100_c0_g1_i1.p1 TRINITY_DN140100_c0_g1~~TRINITY_DN140100_c0_g1_i1.p1  ORF type:complete len:238 (-),score=38.36 TRINITY_DN140100_c0_g1_i1:9-722(-)